MVTDPPYGVNYDPAWRNQAGRSINGTTRRIATGTVMVIEPIGARAVGKVVNDVAKRGLTSVLPRSGANLTRAAPSGR